MQITLVNFIEVSRALKSYPSIAIPKVNEAINKSILDILADTRPRVPVVTGQLRDRWLMDFKPLQGTLTSNMNYALYVHELPKTRSGQPKFLSNAIEARREAIEDYFKRAIDNTLEIVARGA